MNESTKELALADDGFIELQLAKFEIKKSDLVALVAESDGLKIDGVTDKIGYAKVHDARMKLKTKRVEIEKGGKSLRAKATAFSKAVIARETEFTSILSPREEELGKMEDTIDELKEQIRIDEEKAEDVRIQKMSDKLGAVGAALDWISLKGLSEEQFETLLQESTAAFNERKKKEEEEREELARKQKEEETERLRVQEANRLESERLAKVKEEQDKQAKELQAQQERIREEREALLKQKNDVRKQKLFDTGLTQGQSGWSFQGEAINDKDLMVWNDLNDIEFNILIDRLVDGLGRMKKRKEDARLAEEERIRLKTLKDQEEENLRLQKEREERERVAEEERLERLNQGPDTEKFRYIEDVIVVALNAVRVHVMKSKKGKAGYQQVQDEMVKAIETCRKQYAQVPK